MSEGPNEPTRCLIVLRPGLELTRLARIGPDADGSKFAETYRPPVGSEIVVPEIQAGHLVRNGACAFADPEALS